MQRPRHRCSSPGAPPTSDSLCPRCWKRLELNQMTRVGISDAFTTNCDTEKIKQNAYHRSRGGSCILPQSDTATHQPSCSLHLKTYAYTKLQFNTNFQKYFKRKIIARGECASTKNLSEDDKDIKKMNFF